MGSLLRLVGNYVKRRGGHFAAIYVRENGQTFGLRKWGQFGWIMGKRCGSTQNIAETAQEQYSDG